MIIMKTDATEEQVQAVIQEIEKLGFQEACLFVVLPPPHNYLISSYLLLLYIYLFILFIYFLPIGTE